MNYYVQVGNSGYCPPVGAPHPRVLPNNASHHSVHNKPQEAEHITSDEHLSSIHGSPTYFLNLFIDKECTTRLLKLVEGKNITEDEMRCFLAILYLTGYVELPRRRMFWERSPDTHNSLVAQAMQRDRFETIFTAINTAIDLTSFIEWLQFRFVSCAPSDEHHAVGDVTVGKLNVWCGCSRGGYCVFFTPHTKGDVNAARSLTHSYVTKLGRIKELTIETQYAEAGLAYELQRMGTRLVPIAREKSSFSASLCGVDRLEANINLYAVTTRTKKFSSQLLTIALDLALCNAYYLYKSSRGEMKCLDLLNFRRNIVVYYLQHYGRPVLKSKGGRCKVKKVRLATSDARFDGVRHYVVPQDKQTRCGMCTAKTTTRCQKCDVGVHVKCFVEFHTKAKQ